MNILTSQLPSGGYGYAFPSVSVTPMNFMQMVHYIENVPTDPLEKYLYDIRLLMEEDRNIENCYVMDVDFLIFYKKLCSVSSDLTYNISIKCPHCGQNIKKVISLEKDIHFIQADSSIMSGAVVNLGGDTFNISVPAVRDFLKVFELYLRYKKISDLSMIKTIALFSEFEDNPNQIENNVIGATHDDITALLALRDLYYDRVEPISLFCSNTECPSKTEKEGGRVTVSIANLIVDFFRDIINNSPISSDKILFKQVSQNR